MKQRMIKAGVLLFGLMVLFTVISRAAYNMSIAEVSAEIPEPQTFTPDVSAQGVVTGSQEIAVSTAESVRVKTVHVMAGQAVEAGEVLYELDLQDLTEKMREKQLELQSLDLQIRGTAESEAEAERSRQLSRSQAQEDYNRIAARENEAVDAALNELRQAQEQYQNVTAGQAGIREPASGQADSGQAGIGESAPDQVNSSQTGGGATTSEERNPGQPELDQGSSWQAADQLRAAVQEKQAAYDQAVRNREDSLYNAQKSVDSANLKAAKSYSVEQSRILRGQKEGEIAKLQALLDVQGRVAAPVKGMVTEVSVKAGSASGSGGDILLSDISGGASLTVTFPEELREYVREGAQAVVSAADSGSGQPGMPGAGSQGAAGSENQAGKHAVSDRVTIRSVADNSMTGNPMTGNLISGNGAAGMDTNGAGSMPETASGGSFTVTVDLQPDHFTAGEKAMLKVEIPPDNYDTCIPLGALHLREKDQYYVNVAEKRSTILGEEWVIRQVDVDLLEKNEKFAAVEGISSEQEVVAESSRTLEEGSRVKMKDEG